MDEPHDDPSAPPLIKQLSVFVANRLGALLTVTRCLDAYGLELRAINIIEAADHAVFRLLVDRPGLAKETLQSEGYSVFESDILGVALPSTTSDGIRRVLSALLLAELNGLPRSRVETMLRARGYAIEGRWYYQITFPLPELMALSEQRLRGLGCGLALLENKVATSLDHATGSHAARWFDSWILRARKAGGDAR